MKEALSERRQCPYCKKWDVYQAYNEYGEFSDWCPHCRKSIASENEIKLFIEESKQYSRKLLIFLIFIYPLYSINRLIQKYQNSKEYFIKYPEQYTIIFYDIFLGAFIISFSIYAGMNLWKNNENAIKIIKIFLVSLCLYSVSMHIYHVKVTLTLHPIILFFVDYSGNILFAILIYVLLLFYQKQMNQVKNTLINSHN